MAAGVVWDTRIEAAAGGAVAGVGWRPTAFTLGIDPLPGGEQHGRRNRRAMPKKAKPKAKMAAAPKPKGKSKKRKKGR